MRKVEAARHVKEPQSARASKSSLMHFELSVLLVVLAQDCAIARTLILILVLMQQLTGAAYLLQ